MPKALAGYRICDFTGQLAGAGATRHLAAFGAEVIRIEDPVNQGRWDILRGQPPYKDERRGINLGGSFNNHNVGKLGITLNLRTERGKELLTELVRVSDVVSENFSAGVMDRLGFGYDQLAAIKQDIIYVSNSGFGKQGPYGTYKTWGPIVQAVSGLTWTSKLRDLEPAGWGYSYMDHTGGYYMCIAILAALHHRNVTGEGQWVDMSCTDAGATLTGPAILDYTANGRPTRRDGLPDSNHNRWPPMAPHAVYPAEGEDNWIAVACRDEADWHALAAEVGEPWTDDPRFATLGGRIEHEAALDEALGAWTATRDKFAAAERLRAAGVPASAVQRPGERIDHDENTSAWGLWPTVQQTDMGDVRVDGVPAHLGETEWELTHGAPNLGEHNEEVYSGLLGLDAGEIASLREEGVI